VVDLFLAKAVANRDKDREFDMDLLRYGYVTLAAAIDRVAQMPVDEKSRRDLRARIRRWARMVQERGHELPAG
jgi:hypothetical protein